MGGYGKLGENDDNYWLLTCFLFSRQRRINQNNKRSAKPRAILIGKTQKEIADWYFLPSKTNSKRAR
jgi:hypothetical protein